MMLKFFEYKELGSCEESIEIGVSLENNASSITCGSQGNLQDSIWISDSQKPQ